MVTCGALAVPGWGGYVPAIDVARDQLVFDTDPGDERLWAVCPSPDLQHLTIRGDGELRVVDLAGMTSSCPPPTRDLRLVRRPSRRYVR